MEVELLHYSPKELIIKAIRRCWRSNDKSDDFGESDQKLIRKIIKKGHTSTLEHSLYTFDINNISRACLQEIARHRIGIGLSVESTRYTLKRILKGEDPENFLIDTGNEKLNRKILSYFNEVTEIIEDENLTNDIAKYAICENYPVSLIMSFNIRSLRHFISLRSSPAAHKEIKELANTLYNMIPIEHKIFFWDFHL